MLKFWLGMMLLWASGVFANEQEPIETPATKNAHQLYVGVARYHFFKDLTFFHAPAWGGVFGYDYELPQNDYSKARLGIETHFFISKKNGYENQHIVFLPQLKLQPLAQWPVAAVLAFSADVWRMKRKIMSSQPLHEDLLFGGAVGVESFYLLKKHRTLQASLKWHFQEWDFATNFLSIGVGFGFHL